MEIIYKRNGGKKMKTKIKRHYRSAISILLSVCMLISCMTVGLIATDAARVTEAEAAVPPIGGLSVTSLILHGTQMVNHVK